MRYTKHIIFAVSIILLLSIVIQPVSALDLKTGVSSSEKSDNLYVNTNTEKYKLEQALKSTVNNFDSMLK